MGHMPFPAAALKDASGTRRPDGRNIPPQGSDELEIIVVRLLEIAGRCRGPAMQYQLMWLADDLVKIIDEIKG